LIDGLIDSPVALGRTRGVNGFGRLLLPGFHGKLAPRDDEFALASTVLDGFFCQDFMETYLSPTADEFALVSAVFWMAAFARISWNPATKRRRIRPGVNCFLDGFFCQDFMESCHQETTRCALVSTFFGWLLLSGFQGNLPPRDDEFALVSTIFWMATFVRISWKAATKRRRNYGNEKADMLYIYMHWRQFTMLGSRVPNLISPHLATEQVHSMG
jgi:hypothetical protein